VPLRDLDPALRKTDLKGRSAVFNSLGIPFHQPTRKTALAVLLTLPDRRLSEWMFMPEGHESEAEAAALFS